MVSPWIAQWILISGYWAIMFEKRGFVLLTCVSVSSIISFKFSMFIECRCKHDMQLSELEYEICAHQRIMFWKDCFRSYLYFIIHSQFLQTAVMFTCNVVMIAKVMLDIAWIIYSFENDSTILLYIMIIYLFLFFYVIEYFFLSYRIMPPKFLLTK